MNINPTKKKKSMWTKDWEGARNTFSHCVAIDEDDRESWSNLASIYLHLRTN